MSNSLVRSPEAPTLESVAQELQNLRLPDQRETEGKQRKLEGKTATLEAYSYFNGEFDELNPPEFTVEFNLDQSGSVKGGSVEVKLARSDTVRGPARLKDENMINNEDHSSDNPREMFLSEVVQRRMIMSLIDAALNDKDSVNRSIY